jgi:hypothetical protein
MFSVSPHAKHLFILTTAGKPVYTRHPLGADGLSSLAPILGAVLSRAEDTSDPLTSLALTDGTLLAVSTRGPFHLVILSRTGETLHSLTQQLRLAWALLLFATLPTVSLEAALRARPGADVRPQCAGLGAPMGALFRSFSRSPSAWLDAYPMVALASPSMRARAGAELLAGAAAPLLPGAGGGDARVLYALLLAGNGVVAWAAPPRSDLALRPGDLQCILAFLGGAGGALHRGGSDAWVPIALPLLSSTTSAQAYVARLAGGAQGGGAPSPPPPAAPAPPPAPSPSLIAALAAPWGTPVKSPPPPAPAAAGSPTQRAARLEFASPLAVAGGGRRVAAAAAVAGGGGGGGGAGYPGAAWHAAHGAPPPSPTSPPAAAEEEEEAPIRSPQFDADDEPRAPAPPPPPPAVSLVLVVAGGAPASAAAALPDAVASRAAAISRALFDCGAPAAALRVVGDALNVGGWGGGDLLPGALWRELGLPAPPAPPRAPALLHWLYLWKPTRQWVPCLGWPPAMAGGGAAAHKRRKALLRAYAAVYDSACAPGTRHALASFRPPPAPAGGAAAAAEEEEGAAPCITTLAAINTKYALALAAWGFGSRAAAGAAMLPTDLVPGLMEKLAKALKAQQGRWFAPPAPLPGFV